jgi:hypothetical protein
VFRARPREVYVPSDQVYVVTDPAVGDYDVFRYGGAYWVFEDGYWYRGPSYRGPFVVIQPRAVPVALYRVPRAQWKHHASGPPRYDQGGPPGLMKKEGGMPPGQLKKEERGRGHDRGHGGD